MKALSLAAKNLWAKKSSEGSLLWLPLVTHMADSAAMARRLWNHWLSDGVKKVIAEGLLEGGDVEKLFIFLAAGHDIGKATPVFQAKNTAFIRSDLDERIEENLIAAGLPIEPYRYFDRASKTPHALATYFILKQVGCNTNTAIILGAHHGKPPAAITLNQQGIGIYSENFYLDKKGKKTWTAVQRELIDFALEQAGYLTIEELPNLNMAAQVILSGLVIMTDWIASNEGFFPYYRLEDDPDFDSSTRIQFAWDRLSFLPPWKADNEWMRVNLYQERFNYIPHFIPNPIQTAVLQSVASIHEPGILVLEAPMGVGKTEAALAAAEIFAYNSNLTGVFFALPTQATSDGIFPRMEKWIKELDDGAHSIKLAHGKAQFNEDLNALKFLSGASNIGEEDENGAVVHQWFEGQKKSLLADFVVGTIDQLLLAALKQKHVMLRHLGLANKVVVIDECHAYDAYMSRYLDMALRWLGAYHVPVIVLSATLPVQKRKMVIDAYLNTDSKPISQADPLGRSTIAPIQKPQWSACSEYPLVTYTDGNKIKQHAIPWEGDLREISLEYITEDADAIIEKLDDLLSGGGCAGVIVNTVKRAQKLAQKLREHFGEDTVKLLHSRFLAPDRARKEQELLFELGKPDANPNRPLKRIVIGTQVLEQSLDIDFDVLIIDLCPMDLLLQRIGRLHRHERKRPEKLRSTFCLIIESENDDFTAGTKEIYGEYLLIRTKTMLPRKLVLPSDIPELVQDVYDEGLNISPEPPGYQEAKEKWEKLFKDKEKRACDFRIWPPWPDENIVGWLDTDVSVTEKHGDAAVRDTDQSIEVLLIQEKNGDRLFFLPWRENGRELPPNEIPDDELAKALARQSIRLPRALCVPWAIGETIEELELINGGRLAMWRKSSWLKGELFLILDNKYSATLCGYRLTYDRYLGLLYEEEDKADA